MKRRLSHWAPETASAPRGSRPRPAARERARSPHRVPVTDQHAMADQDTHVCSRERAAHLAHEQVVGMWRRADDLHASRGQVEHKHGVVRHEASPAPHLGREEIRVRDRAPMRPQKGLLSDGTLRHGRPSACCASHVLNLIISINGVSESELFSNDRPRLGLLVRWVRRQSNETVSRTPSGGGRLRGCLSRLDERG